MIRFRRLTPELLDAWLVEQRLARPHERYRLRVWREDRAGLTAIQVELVAYIDEAFWPEAADLAAALDMEAVLLSDGESSAFEESVGFAWKYAVPGEKKTPLPGKLAVTVELRGTRDVYPEMARKDAEGLWRFLAARGVVIDSSVSVPTFSGPAAPLNNIEMIRTPVPGTILFHRNIGEVVNKGDLLATIISKPGMTDGATDVFAPQLGLILTRFSGRFARHRGDLMKIICDNPSVAVRKPGALEE